jgi:hypothetical protein
MNNLSLSPLSPIRLTTSPVAPFPAANVAPHAAKKAPPISKPNNPHPYGSFREGVPPRSYMNLELPSTPRAPQPPPPAPQASPTPPPPASAAPHLPPSPRPSPKVTSPEPLVSPKAAGIGLGIGAAIGAVVGLVEAREKNLSALDTLATIGKSAVGTLLPIATIIDPNQPLLNRVAAVGTTAVSAIAGLALFGVSSPALAVVGLIGGVVAIGASLGQDGMHLRNPEANPTGGIITSTARLIKRGGALVNNSQAPAVAVPPQPRQEIRTRQDTPAPQIPSEPAPTRSCVVNNPSSIRIFNDNNKELFVRLDKADKAFCVVDNLVESGKLSEANLEDDGRIKFYIKINRNQTEEVTFSSKADLNQNYQQKLGKFNR